MARKTKQEQGMGDTGRTLIRIVIASYFIATATGIIPGYDPSALTGYLLPEPWATYSGASLGLALAFMILTGIGLRTAALLLSLMLFWSSYIGMVNLGLQEQLGHFWRDLALIGALLLTYSHSDSSGGRALFKRIPDVRKIRPISQAQVQPKRVKSEPSPARRTTPLIHLATVEGEEAEQSDDHRAAG